MKKLLEQIKDLEMAWDSMYDAHEAMDSASNEVGLLFREYREAKGISLRDMAKKLKISAAYLSDVELGRRYVTYELSEKMKKL